MEKRRGISREETIRWLLERENPSVRYFTLVDLLGKQEKDEEVLLTKREIMAFGPVPAILAKQTEEGFWGERERFYLDKYRGTVWQLILLAELGADGEDPRIRKACEFILENSQDGESHGFAVNRSGKTSCGRHSEVIPCLTGNMLWSLIRLGYLEDPRVQAGIEWICKYQRCDDGESEPPQGWPYDRFEVCFGKHSCHMGVIKSLKALSAIPADRRKEKVNRKIESLAEYFLAHRIYKRSHDPEKISKPGWLKLGFPLMYQTDLLEILSILTRLGCNDSRMAEALTVIENKKTENNRWILENSFNGKMLVNIEKKGGESKWITLRALQVLCGQQRFPAGDPADN